MPFDRHLRKARTALKLTQKELAEEIDVTPQHISNLETKKGEPSLDVLVKLGLALGVSTDFLLTGKETLPFDAAGAIRAQRDITAARKRLLLDLLDELRTTA